MTGLEVVGAARQALVALLDAPGVGELFSALDGNGEELRIVGGAVRNALMGLPVNEVDLATTALPDEVTRRAALANFKTVPTGIEHGTVTVVVHGRPFEVTSLREDVETDGRRAVVRFGRSFTEDAQRRDFTINALSLGRDGVVHDEVGGLADIAARRVRFIGDPERRIREDYLRILRLFRFHASYAAGPIDADGYAAAMRLREGLRLLSAERVRNELVKLLAAPGAAATTRDMLAGGFWPLLLGGVPHIGRLAGFMEWQGAGPGPAALLPDAPLPRLAALAVLTREDAERLRRDLRLSNAQSLELSRIAGALERLHGRSLPGEGLPEEGLPEDGGTIDPVLIRLVLDLGAPAVCAALALEARAAPGLAALQRRLHALPAFPLTGSNLLARGLRPGPRIGRILATARDAWAEAGCPLDKPSLEAILDRAMSASA
ncbi:poly(A) polymerase [Rhizobiales bacterium GAS113]|nr:poly(A) polymerase [Rhizobiales bacterium GAS113]